MLTAISAKYEGEPCAAWLGTDGAGHFVKTIHNGIEYADMQMIAEIYGILRDGLGMAPKEIGAVFAKWNKGRLNSYLIEITAKVLEADDPKTGKPMVDIILDRAGQKGTGKWSVIEAQQLGIPATAIEAAVAARVLSSLKDERIAAEKAYGKGGVTPFSGKKDEVLADLELALFAGKIAAYAQGFAVMAGASKEFNWNLPLPTIAKIWRAGCIIRSQFLGTLAKAFSGGPVANLLMTPAFIEMMKEAHPALRRIVARAAEAGLPTPALSSALGYFDSYRLGRGTSNLIQAQRDFFGAHGFERIDAVRRASRSLGQRRCLTPSPPLSRSHKEANMTWHPADNRYDAMIYNRCGRSGLKLPAISLGLWHNFGDDTPHKLKQRDLPQGIRSRHHPFRPRQQLRPAGRNRRDSFRRYIAQGFRGLSRRADHLDQGRLRDVAGTLRRVGQPQIPALQPRPEPEAHGARLCRYLLFAPLRPGHAARGDDGRARHGGPFRQGALRRHLLLQFAAHAARRPTSFARWERPSSSTSRAIR